MLIASTDEFVLPDVDAPGVEVWRDVDGSIAAVGYRHDLDHCLHVPRVGTFLFTDASDEIRLAPEGSASDDLIQDALHRIAMPLALQLRGVQVLHASAVVIAGGVVALCGRSGAGKSTLAYGLGRRGFTLWGDDAVAFEPVNGGLRASPLPFRMRLRPASAEWFDDLAHQKGSEVSTPWRSGSPGPFRALFVLERSEEVASATGAELVRLAPVDAFSSVLPHAYYLALDDVGLNQRLLSAYLDLADRLPVFVLRYRPRLSLVDTIAELVAAQVSEL